MDLILYTADFLTPEQLIKLYSCVLEIGCYSGLLLNIANCIEMKLLDKEKFESKHTQLIGKIITKAYNIRGTECSESAKRLVLENNSEMSIEPEKNSTTKKVDKKNGQNTRNFPIDDSKTKKAVKNISHSNDVELLSSNRRSRKNIRITNDEAKPSGEKRQLPRGKAKRKVNVVQYVKDQESKIELITTEAYSPTIPIAVLQVANETAAITGGSKHSGVECINAIACPLPLSDGSETNLQDPQTSTSDDVNIIFLQNSNYTQDSYVEVPFSEADASAFVSV